MNSLLLHALTAGLLSPIYAQTPYRNRSFFNKQVKAVFCREPLPVFALDDDSNPINTESAQLCTCIWNKLPESGHERKTAIKILNGEDPGWFYLRVLFEPRFGKAIESCGGYEL